MFCAKKFVDTPAPRIDPYEMRTKSIRIRGVVTSVGLENFSWDVLSLIADQSGLTLNQQVSRLHDGYLSGSNSAANFCSYLRITCMLHLSTHLPLHDSASPLLKRPVPFIRVGQNSLAAD